MHEINQSLLNRTEEEGQEAHYQHLAEVHDMLGEIDEADYKVESEIDRLNRKGLLT